MKNNDEIKDIVQALIVCLLIVWVFAITGCASRQELAAENQKIRAMNRTLVELKCPETGCVVSSLTIHNPEQIKLQKETNGWDTFSKFLSVISVAIPEARAAYVAGEFLKAAVNRDSSTTTTNTDNSVTGSYNAQETHNATASTTDSYNDTQNTSDSYNDTSTESTTESTATDSHNVTVTNTTTTDTEVSDAHNSTYN